MSRTRHGSRLGWIAGTLCGTVGLLAAAAPAPATAQTNTYSTILVSSHSPGGRQRVSVTQALAQPFTTGNVGDGYTLSAVRLKFSFDGSRNSPAGDEIPGDRRVTGVTPGLNGEPIFAPSTSDPSRVVVRLLQHDSATSGPTETGAIRLMNPTVLRSAHEHDAWNLFTPPPSTNINLDKQTTFYIEVSHDLADVMIPWSRTTNTSNVLGQSGWSMSRYLARDTAQQTATWQNGSDLGLLLVNISGSVNNAPDDTSNPPSTNLRMRIEEGGSTRIIEDDEDLRVGDSLVTWASEVLALDNGVRNFKQDIYTVPGSMDTIAPVAEVLASGLLVEIDGGAHEIKDQDVGRRFVPCARFTDGDGNFNHVCGPPTPIARELNVGVMGTPAISGTARVGETLTAEQGSIMDDNGVPDLDDADFTFQWQRGEPGNTPNWQDIDMATERTYQLVQMDFNKRIRVSVTFEDDQVTRETPGPSDAYPANTVRSRLPTAGPTLVGSFSDGETMSIDTSTIVDPDGTDSAPNWMREYWLFPEDTDYATLTRPINSANYPSAVSAALTDTYMVDGSLANIETYKVLGVVSYTDNLGDPHTVLTDFSAPFNQPAVGDPMITGTLRVGSMLTADTTDVIDGNGAGTLNYQWRVATDNTGTDATNTGTNSANYTPDADDLGDHLQVIVTFNDADGYPERRESAWTAALEEALPMVSVAPKTGGGTVVGGNDAVFTLTRVASDVTGTLDVTIDIMGDGILDSHTPTMTATFAADAETVDVEVPTNTLAQGANNQTVTLAIQDSSGDTYQVDSTSGGNTATVTVSARANRPATGEPTIAPTVAGPAVVGQMLMAARTAVDDLDLLPTADSDFTYQWERVDADGSSNPVNVGTGINYTLATGDVGSRIRVTVRFTDQQNFPEMRTSDAYPSSGTVAAAMAALPVVSVAPKTGGERVTGGEDAVFTLTRMASDITATLEVTISITGDGFPSTPALPTTATFDADAETEEISITTNTLAQGAANQTVTLTISSGTTYEVDSSSGGGTASVTVGARVNRPVDGVLTISGTLTVGEEVEAMETTAITDADGLGTFNYQWRRADDANGTNAADIQGATSASYTLTDDDGGKHMQVIVSFTDRGGTDESVESDWTATAVSIPPSFSIAAPSIDEVEEPAPGGTPNSLVFTVMLSATDDATVMFSLAGSTATLGDDADFTVMPSDGELAFTDGGPTTQEITISVLGDIVSDPNETVVVTLTESSAGSVIGEMSTATGTITERPDPIVVSAEAISPDRDIEYSADSDMTRVNFTISLSKAAPSSGTVNWRAVVGDGTREVTGTVNFAAGDTMQSTSANFPGQLPSGGMIEIQLRPFAASGRSVVSSVAADSTVERGSETVQNRVIAERATIPSDRTAGDFATTSMLSAFGRVASTRLVETVWNRTEAYRYGAVASHASLGGRSIDTTAYAPGASASQAAEETARLLGIEVANPALAFTDDPDDGPVAEGNLEDFASWAGLPNGSGIPRGTSFAFAHGEGGLGAIVYWGDVSHSTFRSRLEDDEFSVLASDGAVSTYSLGLDYRLDESILLGLAMSRSSGDAEYSFADLNDGSGDLSSSLTTATPWLRWKSPSGLEVWGAVGIGSGAADGMLDGSSVEMDISMRTIAAGAWNPITTVDGTNIAAKADVFTATVSSEGASAVVDGTDASSRRIRLAAEMSSERAALAGKPTPYVIEIGARHDSGEAESGAGIDVAGSFSYGDPRSSFSMSGRGGMTLYHGQEGFSEIGLGFGVAYDSGADAHGLLFSLEPTWNAPRSNVDDLMWDADSFYGSAPSSAAGAAVRTRLGYGVSALDAFALATLYGETQSGEEGNRMRLGGEMQDIGGRAGTLRFDLYGELRDSHAGTEQAVMLEGGLEF